MNTLFAYDWFDARQFGSPSNIVRRVFEASISDLITLERKKGSQVRESDIKPSAALASA